MVQENIITLHAGVSRSCLILACFKEEIRVV